MRLALCGLLASAVVFGGAMAAEAKMCANTYGGDVVVAKRMKCSKARDIVRTWAVRYRRDGVVNRRVMGFRCRDRSNSVEGLVVRCTRGRKSVNFYANVPQ
jgi:hypothetical protein